MDNKRLQELTTMEDLEQAGPSTSRDSDSEEEYPEVDPYEDNTDEPSIRTRPQKSKLDANLRGLMGEANVRYARGDIETAKKMCFEVMRQVPDSHEPYVTLAQIFENSDLTKYEGYLTIASCLCPQDSGIWCRLAEHNLQGGKVRDAISCYTKAIRAAPRNMELHVKRLSLVEQIGDRRLALGCKRNMAEKLPRSQSQMMFTLCKEVAKSYHEHNNLLKALEVLKIPFKRTPKKITPDLVNMMLELLILTRDYAQCLDIFIQYCNFMFEITLDVNNKIVIDSYVMPDDVQIDIKVKFIVCVIKLECFTLLPPLIDSIIREENVENIGDLYLDVAEDLMASNIPFEALKLLVPLVKSTTYNLAAVWLKYAECLYNCNLLEQAVEAYFTVMTMAPQHVEVLYPLAMTLLKLDKKPEALEVLSQDLSTNKIDVAVLIERMKLLKQIDDLDEYWKCAELLLSRHAPIIKYPEEIKVAMTTSHSKFKKIAQLRRFRNDLEPVEIQLESIREPSLQTEYQVFRDILKFAMEKKAYAQMQRFAFMGLASRKFVPHYKDILVAALISCIYNNDTYHGYNLIRYIVMSDVKNNLSWNLFNLLLQFADDVRHNRFITRFKERLSFFRPLLEIDANYCLSYTYTNFMIPLKYFMNEFRKNRLPYWAFILGVTLLQGYSRICKKSSMPRDDKNQLGETISYLFLYYANTRSREAQVEVFYNLGRMYHQLGLVYLAEKYYLKALALQDVEEDEVLGLKYESAYNLHLIYKQSGNLVAARNVLMTHIVI